MLIQSRPDVLHQCTGCPANGSIGMIRIPISHPDESVCCQVFGRYWLLTDFIPLDMNTFTVGCEINSNKKHVSGMCRESCLRLRRGHWRSCVLSAILAPLSWLKPRRRVDHLRSCIGEAFHEMDSIDQAIACHRLSFVNWHASSV